MQMWHSSWLLCSAVVGVACAPTASLCCIGIDLMPLQLQLVAVAVLQSRTGRGVDMSGRVTLFQCVTVTYDRT